MHEPAGEPYDPNTGDLPAPTGPYQPGPYQGGPYRPPDPASPYPQSPYPQSPYAQSPYPQPPYPQPPGYPPPGYGRYGPPRPGTVSAAAVLCHICAGFLILSGLLLFLGASIVQSLGSDGGHTMVTAELILDGVLDLIAAGLLIAGAIGVTGGANSGRILLSVGSGIVIAESVYWIARTGGAATVWSLIFAALVIVALAMVWTRGSSEWIRQTRR